jgi:hypothetical protein
LTLHTPLLIIFTVFVISNSLVFSIARCSFFGGEWPGVRVPAYPQFSAEIQVTAFIFYQTHPHHKVLLASRLQTVGFFALELISAILK